MDQEINQPSNAIDLPDLVIPEPESYIKSEPEVEEDKKQVAIQFGFIGLGQAGCKMANEFYRLGYRRVIAVNTAKTDFAGLDIPVKRQLVLGDGSGAGKDPAKGAHAVEAQREDILSLIRKSFGDKVDKLVVLASAGGGTGNGGTLPMIQIAKDYMKELGKEPSRNVGALVALPKDSEKGIAQINAAKLVEELFARAEVDLAPLIIVDNEQIAKQWPSASIGQVFDFANKNICGLVDIFNTLACRPSQFSAFDKADLCSVLDKGAVCFGTTKLQQVDSASAISDAIRTNLQRGLLVEGINLASSEAGAGVLVGPIETLNTLPSSFVDEAFKTLARVLGSESKPIAVHQGVFETTKPDLFLYTIAGGFDIPTKRVEKMKRG